MNVLVIALDAAGPLELDDAEVFVVAPALNSRLRHWLSDDDDARRGASERLAACLDRLECAGLHATGRIGDADPLQAVADTLPRFAADEIVIAAHSERSRGIAEKIAPGVRERFALPVHDAEGVWRRAAA